jgi:hypothetical protein
MVERQLPKLHTRVRFPSPAPAALMNRMRSTRPAVLAAILPPHAGDSCSESVGGSLEGAAAPGRIRFLSTTSRVAARCSDAAVIAITAGKDRSSVTRRCGQTVRRTNSSSITCRQSRRVGCCWRYVSAIPFRKGQWAAPAHTADCRGRIRLPEASDTTILSPFACWRRPSLAARDGMQRPMPFSHNVE